MELDQLTLSALQKLFLSELAKLGPSTSNEVAASLSDNFARRNTIRRRASDLLKMILISEQNKRICKISGKSATEYVVNIIK